MKRLEDNDEMPKLTIRQENEFKKIKLKLEHHAFFPDSFQLNLPPEVEGMFLDSIFSFAKAYRNSKITTVFKKIGSPKFKFEHELSNLKIDKGLERIINLLAKNNLILNIIYEYKDEQRLLYKFITEELFLQEIDDFVIPGMNICFIYEDFHPNDKCDLERITKDFLKIFLDNKSSNYEDNYIKDGNINSEINNFRSLFKKFKVKFFDFKELIININKAKITFEISFWGKISGTNSKINYSGEGSLIFKKNNRNWVVKDINLPISG